MEQEYADTVLIDDDTVAIESPVNGTEEVLNVCGYVPDSEDKFENFVVPDSEDQFENYAVPDSEEQVDDCSGKDIVLDSEDEELVTPSDVRGTMRLSCRGKIGSFERRRTPSTGLFRRVGNKSGEHGFSYRDPTRNSRAGEESSAIRTNTSRNPGHDVAVDSVISSLSDKQRTPKSKRRHELCVNQEKLEIVVMTKDSVDENKHLSGDRVMEGDASSDIENVKLNQDEYTEPIESQSKALEFVDQYLLLNDLGSFGDVEEAKQINRIRSPPSLGSKGSLSLARKINLELTESKYANFDWVENPIENGGCTFSKSRNDSTFVFKGDRHEQSSASKESGNVNVHEAQHEMDALIDPFDVGPNTQMAAEAMQLLVNSPIPQQSGNTLDSSTIVYRRSRFKRSFSPREAFVSWKSKSKRSKAVSVSTLKVQMEASAQLPVSESLITNRFARNSNLEKSSGMIKSSTPQERRLIDDHKDVSKLEFSKKCLNVKTDSSSPVIAEKTKGHVKTNVADSSGLSKLNKRARLPGSNRHCYPTVAGDEDNKQTELLVYNRRRKCPPSVPRNENNAQTELLVYKRRCKRSSERKHSGSAANVSGSLSPIRIDIGASKPSNQLHELKEVSLPCSVDGSVTNRLNELPNAKSSTLQVCGLRERSKSQCKTPFKSTKELMKLGHRKSLSACVPKDSRKRRAKENVCVLFSQNLDLNILKKQKKIVERLGFSVASCCSDATHFVADRFMRTRNMMEAIALGKPVVTHLWLESCEQAGYLIDEKSYILRDEKKEKEIGFSMPLTLARAGQHSLLKGRRVFITTNVKPSIDVITCLVRAVQCQVVQNIGGAESKYGMIPSDLLILSSKEDYKICMPFLEKGACIYDSELLLNGIITQKLDYERHQIFKDFAESKSLSSQRRKNLQVRL